MESKRKFRCPDCQSMVTLTYPSAELTHDVVWTAHQGHNGLCRRSGKSARHVK